MFELYGCGSAHMLFATEASSRYKFIIGIERIPNGENEANFACFAISAVFVH